MADADRSERVAGLNQGALLQPHEVTYLARSEKVPEAVVKAAIQAVGPDRAKIKAHLRVSKSEGLVH